MTDVRRAAVLGSPIQHSWSPALHRAAYEDLGLPWQYDAIDVSERELPGFLADLGPEWVGLSLTMPLKTAVLPLLTDRSENVVVSGAANTVLLGRSTPGQPSRIGHNTDIAGIVAAVRECAPEWAQSSTRRHNGLGAAILGGGATARSAVVALGELAPSRAVVVARRPEATAELVDLGQQVGVELEVLAWNDSSITVALDCELVISTVPAGAADTVAVHARAGRGILLDVVYAPWPTVLASAWSRHGLPVAPGILMLLHQAAAQVTLLTGQPASLAAMRAVLPASLLSV
jgi:shikimate dehydrogenase